MTTSFEKLTSFTKAFTVCLDSQCAEDLFTVGLEMEGGDADTLNLDRGAEQVPYKERMVIVKKKFELDDKGLMDLRFVFERLGRTASGALDVMEVQNAFRYWKISLTDAELRRMIEKYADEEQEGIDFPEFIAMIEKKKQATKLEKGYAENFKKYDVGNNGFLSEKNLLKALKKFDYLNCDTDTVQLLDLTLMVNKDKDGNFNFRDYIQVLRSKGVLK